MFICYHFGRLIIINKLALESPKLFINKPLLTKSHSLFKINLNMSINLFVKILPLLWLCDQLELTLLYSLQ